MPPNEAGTKALAHLDAVLAKQPEKDGHMLSAALRCLGEYRDGLVAAQRKSATAEGRGRLEHVNAIISSVMAVQYPLGEEQWPELQKARGWLADALKSG